MTDTTNAGKPAALPLPAKPAIPASNASYEKLVNGIHSAATVNTPETAVQVIGHMRDNIGGVNTYAKIVRRYADACIAALNGEAPTAAPGDVLKAADAKVAAKPAIVKAKTHPTGTAKPKTAAKRKPRAKKAVAA